MPAPSVTSLEEIVAAGVDLVDAAGVEGLTMSAVATSVGVRAPSLYKHVAGRAELIRLIAESVVGQLGEALRDATDGKDARSDLIAQAGAFRAFANSRPRSYGLVFSPVPEEWRPSQEILEAASQPVLETVRALTGPERGLDGARLVTAWAHGFVTMELAGGFRLDGNLDGAFSFGIEALVDALTRKTR